MDGLFQLFCVNVRFESESNLRARFGMRNIPAFCFAPGFAKTLGGSVVGMDLYRKLIFRKQKFQQQREPLRITRRGADQRATKFLAQVGKRAVCQRTVFYSGVISREPGFANFFAEFVIRVDRRKVERAPRAWVEGGRE